MKLRRIISLCMASALSMCAVCGCAEKDDPAQTEQTTSPETTTAATTAAPEPSVTRMEISDFPAPEDIAENAAIPDLFTTLSGEKVVSPEDYEVRLDEIRDMYQYYMYGFWPDRSKETVTYSLDGENLVVTIEKDGNTSSFDALVALPDPAASPAPDGGYPVIIALGASFGGGPFGHGIPYEYANENGYAVITFNTPQVAADDTSRTGAFYELYPYNKENVMEQTGTLMAWGWGGSKIIDALENGLGEEAGISAENTVLTGVSRYGKAAFVGGAFEERFKVVMPACSGAGGVAMYRYNPGGNIYDYSSVGGRSEATCGSPEHLGSLQSSGEQQWFNDTFLKFKTYSHFPVDQHMMSALCGTNGRSLFIISELDIDWTNPPAMHATFLKSQESFEFIGADDHIAINQHWTGHAVNQEDLEKAIPFCNFHFYGDKLPFDIKDIQTSVYDLEVNRQEKLDGLLGG